uniref:uncharacterized protein LOC122597294 n=1 Tax=Erigeron canadensis TaxID=72917 RepID=UPI001CB93F3B|nr:uncharacterized protein LOC122597294 [Erigeron canadensis]
MAPPTPSKKKLHSFEMPDDLSWPNQKRNHVHMRHAPVLRTPDLDQPQTTIHKNVNKSAEAKEKHNTTTRDKRTKRTQVEANCSEKTAETKTLGNKGSKAPTFAVPTKQEKCGPSKLSIGLTREEIEEDFYGMTEKRLPRKLMKRDKSVKQHLDDLFPGLSLEGETSESLLKKFESLEALDEGN